MPKGMRILSTRPRFQTRRLETGRGHVGGEGSRMQIPSSSNALQSASLVLAMCRPFQNRRHLTGRSCVGGRNPARGLRPQGGPLLNGPRLPRRIPLTSCQHHPRPAVIPTPIRPASARPQSVITKRGPTVVHGRSSHPKGAIDPIALIMGLPCTMPFGWTMIAKRQAAPPIRLLSPRPSPNPALTYS